MKPPIFDRLVASIYTSICKGIVAAAIMRKGNAAKNRSLFLAGPKAREACRMVIQRLMRGEKSDDLGRCGRRIHSAVRRCRRKAEAQTKVKIRIKYSEYSIDIG